MRYACWNEELPGAQSLNITRELALLHAHRGGVVGTTLARLIDESRYNDLCSFEVDYTLQWKLSELENVRQCLAFFQKNVSLPSLRSPKERSAVAFSKFLESEVACKDTNALFRKWKSGALFLRPDDVRVLYSARQKIFRVLGACPSIAALHLAFGPGATTRTKKSESCPQIKFAGGLVCSDELLHSGLLQQLLREFPHWTGSLEDTSYCIDEDGWLIERNVVLCDSGRLEFVPKTALVDRSIVVEPVLNTLLQHGIGRYLKSRLRQHGIDITDQSLNQRLARQGSLTGKLATLDLSSASDTISTELVKFLVPDKWFDLLSAARSGSVRYGQHTIALEKFSSMGNGFTFPLETLIFWALSQSCSLESVSAYGDDIICNAADVSRVVEILELCGFTVNLAKSYVSGLFRESCGGDYYFGFDVRPFYQRSVFSPRTLFILHNFYKRHLSDELAGVVLGFIPMDLRLWGPDGFGDGHLISDRLLDFARRKTDHVKKGYGGYTFDTLALRPRRLRTRYLSDYVSPLYSIYCRGDDPIDPVWHDKEGIPHYVVPGQGSVVRQSIYTFG